MHDIWDSLDLDATVLLHFQPDFKAAVDDLKSIWEELTALPAVHTVGKNATHATPIAPVETILSIHSRITKDAQKLYDIQAEVVGVLGDALDAQGDLAEDVRSLWSVWNKFTKPTIARRGVMPRVTDTRSGDWYVILLNFFLIPFTKISTHHQAHRLRQKQQQQVLLLQRRASSSLRR
jgi:hypothetical protein